MEEQYIIERTTDYEEDDGMRCSETDVLTNEGAFKDCIEARKRAKALMIERYREIVKEYKDRDLKSWGCPPPGLLVDDELGEYVTCSSTQIFTFKVATIKVH